MIILHGRANSSNVQKAVWAMREMGVDFERVDRGGPFGRLDDPDYRALNPAGRIPALEDGPVRMFESNAILRYLGERYGPALWPKDMALRARVDSVMDWSNSTLWVAIGPHFRAVAFDGKTAADPEVEAGVAACGPALEVLSDIVGDAYAAGGMFTLADIPPAIAIHRLLWIDPSATLPSRITDWYARCAARDAFQGSVFWPAPAA